MREPSCVLNHDVMRLELRDKGFSSQRCPSCGWILRAAPSENDDTPSLESRIQAIEDFLDMKFGEWK